MERDRRQKLVDFVVFLSAPEELRSEIFAWSLGSKEAWRERPGAAAA